MVLALSFWLPRSLRSFFSRRVPLVQSKLSKQEKSTSAASERTNLFAAEPTSPQYGNVGSGSGSGSGRGGGRGSSRAATAPMDAHGHMQLQHREMKDQDAMLDELNRGVDSLKTVGTAIHDEASLHVVRPVCLCLPSGCC